MKRSRQRESVFERGDALTLSGHKAMIHETDARGLYPIMGVIRYRTGDEPASWTAQGKFCHWKDSVSDLKPQAVSDTDDEE